MRGILLRCAVSKTALAAYVRKCQYARAGVRAVRT